MVVVQALMLMSGMLSSLHTPNPAANITGILAQTDTRPHALKPVGLRAGRRSECADLDRSLRHRRSAFSIHSLDAPSALWDRHKPPAQA